MILFSKMFSYGTRAVNKDFYGNSNVLGREDTFSIGMPSKQDTFKKYYQLNIMKNEINFIFHII